MNSLRFIFLILFMVQAHGREHAEEVFNGHKVSVSLLRSEGTTTELVISIDDVPIYVERRIDDNLRLTDISSYDEFLLEIYERADTCQIEMFKILQSNGRLLCRIYIHSEIIIVQERLP